MSTQPKADYRHLSYAELDELLDRSIAIMQAADYRPEYVVPIAGGGLIPAAMLVYKMYKLGIAPKLLPPVTCASYGEGHDQQLIHSEWPDEITPEIDGESTLFVDEICDTGTTIHHLRSRMPQSKYLSIVTKNTVPDQWAIHDSRRHWWVFPWEPK